MNKAPILIFAMGNISRGDDAFGPLLAEQLITWLSAQAQAVQACIELINDQQLVVEHVMDMRDRGMVLFIDAAMQSEEALALTCVHPLPAAQATLSVNSHRCTPAQLLGLYQAMLLCAPPPAHLLSLKGHSYELGEPLSPQARADLPQAFALLHQWLNDALNQVAPNITGRPHA
jgi:hydrogenase maturation protease